MNLQNCIVMFLILLTFEYCIGSTSRIVHVDAGNDMHDGFWRKKVIWKPRMVKDWVVRKYVVGIWKKVWGPVEMKEWVPYPKQPPKLID